MNENKRIVATRDWVLENVGQSDWNTNDESDLSYVKNRTHYEVEKTIELLPNTIAAPGVSSAIADFTEDWDNDQFVALGNSRIYTTFDGKTYTYDSGLDYLETEGSSTTIMLGGNPYLFSNYLVDNGLPFFVGLMPISRCFIAKWPQDDNEHTFSIKYGSGEYDVHQLDPKYIPDSIARKEDISTLVGRPGEGLGSEIFNSYDEGDDGFGNQAEGKYSHAEGFSTNALGDYSHAEGWSTVAKGRSSHAEGEGAKALNNFTHAEGNWSVAEGNTAHAEGSYTYATGNYSHTEGFANNALGEYSHAEGDQTVTFGDNAHAEGSITFAGYKSHTEGQATFAKNYSHAEGMFTYADETSHAQGEMTAAFGRWSHSEGHGEFTTYDLIGTENSNVYNTNTTQNMYIGMPVYYFTMASESGRNSAPETALITSFDASNLTVTLTSPLSFGGKWQGWVQAPLNGYASKKASHVEGIGNVAMQEAQHVQGKYNILNDSDEQYSHIVGNGTSHTARSNAHTLDWQGNAWYSGDVYVGSTSGTNKDAGSKKLVTEDHTQSAASITAGTFAGEVSVSSQTPGTSLLRNSKLVATETTPTVNGEICWLYE